MKKLLLSLFFVFSSGLSLYAEPAVPPYNWDVVLVGSDQYYIDHPESVPRGYEFTTGKTRTDGNHGGFIRFFVEVKGGTYYSTNVKWDGSVMSPVKIYTYDDNHDTIIDRWVLMFEKSYATEGNIEVTYYGNLKHFLYVR